MSNNNERHIALDALRTFSIIGVILIHIISFSFHFWEKNSLAWTIFISIDQLFRFSVPLFVFISGFTLFSKYNENFKFKEFFTRRALRIIPWYLVWSLIIYLYIALTVVPGFVNYPAWKLILLGKVDYHLYFVSMIFQLYLLFPVLMWIYKKLGLSFVFILFVLEALLFFVFTLDGQEIIQLPWRFYDQQQYLFFGTWIFYFVLGFALSDNKLATLRLFLNKYKFFSLLILISTLVYAIYDCFLIITSTSDTNIATRSTRIPVLLYSTSFIISAVLFSDIFSKLSNKTIKIILYFANLSFLVYLIHALVIRILGNFILPNTPLNLIIFTLLVFSLSVFLAQVSVWTAQLIPTKRFLKLFTKN